jgi:hypothetical protein
MKIKRFGEKANLDLLISDFFSTFAPEMGAVQ